MAAIDFDKIQNDINNINYTISTVKNNQQDLQIREDLRRLEATMQTLINSFHTYVAQLQRENGQILAKVDELKDEVMAVTGEETR